MRIIKRQVAGEPLTVIVEYPKEDASVDRLMQKLERMNLRITGRLEDRAVSVDADELYYLESVERKTFLYAKEQVYRYEGNLLELEADLAGTDFVRISRTCIVNLAHLREVRQLQNSHLEAVLDNGEKLIVFRKYLKEVKNAFRRERG
ncbi:MAG: LytTR family transcriptional regulator DNA-binding domain-containing protein [Lachnospiraceae bacterium]|nr:LytTR family transcriptional regulator DNA-binding domain-containing protein [Lachnospiraceae bacterium]